MQVFEIKRVGDSGGQKDVATYPMAMAAHALRVETCMMLAFGGVKGRLALRGRKRVDEKCSRAGGNQ